MKRLLVFAVLGWFQVSGAQNPPLRSPLASQFISSAVDTGHCRDIGAGDPRVRPLSAVCEFALTYLRQLPDFICDQTTTNHGPSATTLLKAQVRFVNGSEQYSHVTINGAPTDVVSPKMLSVLRFVSSGELGSNLVNLFTPPIVAQFRFRKDAVLRQTPASVFEFHVPAKKNTFWTIADNTGTKLHPEYRGELWLDRQRGRLLQISLWPERLPDGFQFKTVKVTIDYGETAIADAGIFLLPYTSETKACELPIGLGSVSCTKNVIVFDNCRKFGTKTRIILDNPQPDSRLP